MIHALQKWEEEKKTWKKAKRILKRLCGFAHLWNDHKFTRRFNKIIIILCFFVHCYCAYDVCRCMLRLQSSWEFLGKFSFSSPFHKLIPNEEFIFNVVLVFSLDFWQFKNSVFFLFWYRWYVFEYWIPNMHIPMVYRIAF